MVTCSVVCRSLCLSVCLSVCLCAGYAHEPCKNDRDVVWGGAWIHGDLRNHELHGTRSPHEKRHLWPNEPLLMGRSYTVAHLGMPQAYRRSTLNIIRK